MSNIKQPGQEGNLKSVPKTQSVKNRTDGQLYKITFNLNCVSDGPKETITTKAFNLFSDYKWIGKTYKIGEGRFLKYFFKLKAGQPIPKVPRDLEGVDIKPAEPEEGAKIYEWPETLWPPETTKGNFMQADIVTKKVERISEAEFFGGHLNIVAGLTGKGKTTTTLKFLTDNHMNGDGRPFLFYGMENSVSNLIVPRIKQFGGVNSGGGNNSCFFYMDGTNKAPESFTPREVKAALIEACKEGRFSAIIIDNLSEWTEGYDKNSTIKAALDPFLQDLHETTALIVMGHLAKEIKGRELVHHIRGGTEFTGRARKVFYIREGKEEKTRIMVKLKDSYGGDMNGGFKTSMETPESDMKIESLSGDAFHILKEHAKPLLTDKDSPLAGEDKKELEIKLIKEKVHSYPVGTWKVDDYYKWTEKDLNWLPDKTGKYPKAYRALKKAGFYTRQKDMKGPYFIRW